MTKTLGMQPDAVQATSAAFSLHLGSLERAASAATEARVMSATPAAYGLQPGDMVIAPWSLGDMSAAVVAVRAAVQSARDLAGVLLAEAAEQREASESDGGAGPALCMPPTSTGPGDVRAIELPGWWAAPYLSGSAGLGVLDGALDRQRWIGDYRAPVYVREVMWADPTLRDPATGLYRRPSGILVPESAAPQVRMPGTGQWQFRHVGPLRSVANGTAPAIPGWVRTGGRMLGPVSTVVGGVTSGYNAGAQQWNDDAGMSNDTRWARSIYSGTVTGAGAAAGGAAGAWAGALAGAAIGSIFPGPGTVIGGVIGGILGGLFGGAGGEKLGEVAVDGTIDSIWR